MGSLIIAKIVLIALSIYMIYVSVILFDIEDRSSKLEVFLTRVMYSVLIGFSIYQIIVALSLKG